MSSKNNINGQAYGFQALTPIGPGKEADLRAFLDQLHVNGSPLARLPRTHMGRWVIIEDFYHDPAWKQPKEDHLDLDYLNFTSNFDGDLNSYLDELCEALAPEAPQLWGRCVGCPENPSADELKRYLKHNQIDCGFFYAAYGGSTVVEVKAALRQRDQVIAFATRSQGLSPEQLQKAFVAEFGAK